jgi:predicted HAD superfamily Cof-like phosphohydrolase
MRLTNYEKVTEFNRTFESVMYDTHQPNLYYKSPNIVKLRLDLIDEEVQELHEACKNNDFIETIDALADILYVVYGAFNAFGVDADKVFDLVHNSNMSKLCKTEKEAVETVEFYKNTQYERYKEPTYKSSMNGFIVYDKITGKILKSKYYLPVTEPLNKFLIS